MTDIEPILNDLMTATLDHLTLPRPALRERFRGILQGQRSSAATGDAPQHGPFFHVTQEEKDTCEVCERQRLSGVPAQSVGAPVAWRYRSADEKLWEYFDERLSDDDFFRQEQGFEEQPLYAAQPPDAPPRSSAASELDALRWRQLPAHLEEFQIDYVGLKRVIDADLADPQTVAALRDEPQTSPMQAALEKAERELTDLARPICCVFNRSTKKYEFEDEHIAKALPGTFEVIQQIRAALSLTRPDPKSTDR